MKALRTFIVVVAALAAVSLHGQQPAAPSQPVFRSGVDLVEVDVSVLDKDRFPIRDLTTQDFTLLEDGKPRPIVSFTSVDLPEAEAAIAPAFRGAVHDVVSNDVPQEGRLVVILMDRTVGLLQQRDARGIAAGIIDQLGPGDLGAVTYSSGFATDSKYPQNFTTDHARLLAAVEHPQFGMTAPPDMTTDGLVEGSGPSGEDYCQPRTLNAIANIAEALSDVPHRRKMLVIVASNMVFQEVGECALIVRMARERAFHALEVANITIDVIDPTGVEYVVPSRRAANLARQENLRLFPARTGGQYQSSNRPEEQLASLFQESRSYYLLGFQPAVPKADGRFHKIEVKVNRAGAHVHARQGYDARPAIAAAAATAPVNTTPLFAALAAAVPTSGIPLNISAVAFAVPGRTNTAVTIAVGIRGSEEITGKAFEVMTAAFDSQSRQVASVRQRTDLNGSLVSIGPLDVLSRLDLKPGLYEIRAAVSEVGGTHTGSVYTYVEVPAFDQEPLAVSGFALQVTPAWPATPIDAIAELLPYAPTTKRTFSARDQVTALLRVYQGSDRPDSVLMTARVTDQLGQNLINETTTLEAGRFQRPRGVDYRLAFPVSQFRRGDYLLTVEATIGKRLVRRDLRFTVR